MDITAEDTRQTQVTAQNALGAQSTVLILVSELMLCRKSQTALAA